MKTAIKNSWCAIAMIAVTLVAMSLSGLAHADAQDTYNETVEYWRARDELAALERIEQNQAMQTRIMQQQQYVPQRWQQPRGLDSSIIMQGNWNNGGGVFVPLGRGR